VSVLFKQRASRGVTVPFFGGFGVADEFERTRLIGDITRILCDPEVPESTRTAGLALIGWLARRKPSELPHAIGVPEARESEGRVRTARAKAR